MNKKPLPISTLCSWKNRIDPTPDYQRPPAWSKKQKQLLIDSILREYDIPKMYWRSTNRDDGIKFEVIDGQQRLRTIWEFRDGEFALSRDADTISDIPCAGQKYEDLALDLSMIFDAYPVDVVIVDEAIQNDEEDEVRDMFLRLQNGTTLKAQEKRNAMPGKMRDFVKTLAGHSFFESCKFKNTRFTYDHVAAQITCLEISGGPRSVRDGDLNRMYETYRLFDANGMIAKKITRTLNYLYKAFPEHTEELKPYNAINLYCLASKLIDGYAHTNTESLLRDWFVEFEHSRWKDKQKDEEDQDVEFVEYRRLTSYSTDGEESISKRVEFLEKLFFLEHPNIHQKDSSRIFSPEQRLAIFRMNKGICQIQEKCTGEKLSWNNWHADHIVPHSKGGETIVSNGQVACSPCNLYKSAR